jgi:hypothetical protein
MSIKFGIYSTYIDKDMFTLLYVFDSVVSGLNLMTLVTKTYMIMI